MELEAIYESDEDTDTTGPQKWSKNKDKGKAQNHGGSRCLVLMTVCLGIICVVLLVFIIAQHISNTAERESLFKSNKNTVQEFNHTINSLQDNYTELMTEKDQLKNNFSSLSQKKLELETRVNDLTAEKSQFQRNIDSLSQKKLEMETRVNDLTAEKSQFQRNIDSLRQKRLELESKVTSLSVELRLKAFNKECSLDDLLISDEKMSWSKTRQYCRDRGADLIIIDTEVKQRCITSFVKDNVWIGLSDIEHEGNLTWVDNSPLNQGFWSEGEPNDAYGNEDCAEIMSSCTSFNLNNWNDLSCSEKRKGICEK
ncbi:CD209 antigen-like protein C [Megalobrama amblycephala]|uniref:CD209 antigen-like protein C n=1 Tax=Megalobrama amblycephala TaxID=75352 RepID=UPI00201481F4|nr:CD209 antigen-like protein C [Megalobrama amblycephala]